MPTWLKSRKKLPLLPAYSVQWEKWGRADIFGKIYLLEFSWKRQIFNLYERRNSI